MDIIWLVGILLSPVFIFIIGRSWWEDRKEKKEYWKINRGR